MSSTKAGVLYPSVRSFFLAIPWLYRQGEKQFFESAISVKFSPVFANTRIVVLFLRIVSSVRMRNLNLCLILIVVLFDRG